MESIIQYKPMVAIDTRWHTSNTIERIQLVGTSQGSEEPAVTEHRVNEWVSKTNLCSVNGKWKQLSYVAPTVVVCATPS